MTRTGKAVEPMGFVAERFCPFVEADMPWPKGARAEVYVIPVETVSSHWGACTARKYEVVKHHSGPRLFSSFGLPGEMAGVCEHMGRLVE